MPNAVSCAYFAARNHIYGKSEKNVFKEGIAGAQSVRTFDTVANSAVAAGHVAAPVKSFLQKAAAFARKIVYPLIICSGVYNTVKSDDKVKTGVSQAAGITTMYAFEQIAENSLKNLNKKILSYDKVKTCKPLKYAWYVLKGMAFVAASLGGYSIGSTGGEAFVDKARSNKKIKAENTQKFPVESDLDPKNIETTLFEDMKL